MNFIGASGWSCTNFLALIRDKCSSLMQENCIYPISQPLLLDNHPLDHQVKMFSVLLSHDLCWGEHIPSVGSIGLERSLVYSTDDFTITHQASHSLLQLYLSLVRPHLDYASPIWSPHVKKDKVEKFACCSYGHKTLEQCTRLRGSSRSC